MLTKPGLAKMRNAVSNIFVLLVNVYRNRFVTKSIGQNLSKTNCLMLLVTDLFDYKRNGRNETKIKNHINKTCPRKQTC